MTRHYILENFLRTAVHRGRYLAFRCSLFAASSNCTAFVWSYRKPNVFTCVFYVEYTFSSLCGNQPPPCMPSRKAVDRKISFDRIIVLYRDSLLFFLYCSTNPTAMHRRCARHSFLFLLGLLQRLREFLFQFRSLREQLSHLGLDAQVPAILPIRVIGLPLGWRPGEFRKGPRRLAVVAVGQKLRVSRIIIVIVIVVVFALRLVAPLGGTSAELVRFQQRP
mmetsp:Transcript_26437/g.62101  ORF Transcript_26437/g.62101 Transcript_26437/m.62101 type:complete len:221 (-) Transcript_26437:851-1513(-)